MMIIGRIQFKKYVTFGYKIYDDRQLPDGKMVGKILDIQINILCQQHGNIARCGF